MPTISSALNTEQTQYRLNELIAELYPMKVQLATTCGYEDLAADDSIDLTDFRKRYILAVKESFFPDEIQEDIGAREIVSDNPLVYCWKKRQRLHRQTCLR